MRGHFWEKLHVDNLWELNGLNKKGFNVDNIISFQGFFEIEILT